MVHSHVHISVQVIDDQLLSRNRHMAWCSCHEILIQRSFDVLPMTRFCHFRPTSSSFSLLATISQIEEVFAKLVISLQS